MIVDGKIYLLFRYALRQQRIYRDWPDQCSLPCESVDDPISDWVVPDDAALLITHVHYRWEELSFLRKTFEENRVPILILADGVLEYRNTWQHEGLPKGSMFQPVFGHKLACIGSGQARLIESWGNPGRCEVVGFPPLDSSKHFHLGSSMGKTLKTRFAFSSPRQTRRHSMRLNGWCW